jgi:hypothetical protein
MLPDERLLRERYSASRQKSASWAVVALAACALACGFPDVSIGDSSNGVPGGYDGAALSPSADHAEGGSDAGGPRGTPVAGSDGAAETDDGSSSGAATSDGGSSSGDRGGSSNGGTSDSGGSASSSGAGSSGDASSSGSGTGPCTCGQGKTLAYPTHIQCGSVQVLGLGLACSGPAQGFAGDGPPCGEAAALTVCSAPVLNLNVACVPSPGSVASQGCE